MPVSYTHLDVYKRQVQGSAHIKEEIEKIKLAMEEATRKDVYKRQVEEKLRQGGRPPGKPWLECAGELAHLHEETARIQKVIEAEFEQIEPEDWI